MEKIKLYLYKNYHVIAFYIGIILLTFALGIKYNYLDYDLFSRLIRGYGIVNLGTIFHNDFISYTPTHTWYDPEWLTSGLLYLIAQKFKFTGLTIFKCISTLLTVYMIILAIKERLKDSKENPYNISFYVLILAVFTGSCILSYTVRCQNITFIILPIWILLLEKIRNGNNKLLYLLPPIMLLWLNCHGASIAGVGILFLYGVGEALNKKPFIKYFIALIFVCLVYFINPWGADFIKFIIDSSYVDRHWIYEWYSPFKTIGYTKDFIPYFMYLAVSIPAFIYSIAKNFNYFKLDKTKIIIFLVTLYLSATVMKHVELFIVAGSIYFYEDIFELYNKLCSKLNRLLNIDSKLSDKINKIKNIILYIVIYLYSAFTIINVPIYQVLYEYIADWYPINAIEFLRINNLKGKLFSPFEYGSYIAWKLYPNIKIYMDGRQEQVYDKEEIFDKLMHFRWQLGDNPYEAFDKYPPDIVLLKTKVGNNLMDGYEDWVKIYSDEDYTIYTREKSAKNEYKEVYRSEMGIIDDMFTSNFKMGNKLPGLEKY